jgi:hypothetical protein
MAKFFFFTDPNLFDAQLANQAFGPAGTSASKDQFRVTDIHSSSSAADIPAFAICDGRICVQADAGGTLSLILKPDQQPPFAFPFISYVIYKGIDPASLLNGNVVATTPPGTNQLLDDVRNTWQKNSRSGDPKKECLGVHLREDASTTIYPWLDPTRYGPDKPIDNLFFAGDSSKEPPPVEGGWRIGNFSATGFGLEIIVERIGSIPKIEWARALENIVKVDSLDQSVTYAPNNANYFKHWHDKEEILNFVDPCAFWGSFFTAKLRVWDAAGPAFKGKPGKEIYSSVLFGSGTNDQPGTDGNFYNRNRACIDIRNEHGQSLNYYKNASIGNLILLALEDQEIDDGEVNYYSEKWPCYGLDGVIPQDVTPASGDHVNVKLALPKTNYSLPVNYVSAGYVSRNGKLKPIKDQERFISVPKRADSPYLEAITIAAPIVTVGSEKRFAASYQKISHFKRCDEPPSVLDPTNLAPIAILPMDYFLPIPGPHPFFVDSTKTLVKTFADEVLVQLPSERSIAFVARPGFAQDGANVYLFLFPTLRYLYGTRRPAKPEAGVPTMQALNRFLPNYLTGSRLEDFVSTNLNPPVSPNTPTGTNVHIVHERSRGSVRKPSQVGSDFIVVALRRTDYETAVVPDPGNPVLPGSMLLTLTPSKVLADVGGKLYVEAVITYSRLRAPANQTTIGREEDQPFPTVYAHEDI